MSVRDTRTCVQYIGLIALDSVFGAKRKNTRIKELKIDDHLESTFECMGTT